MSVKLRDGQGIDQFRIGVISASDLHARSGTALTSVQSAVEQCFGRGGPGLLLVDELPEWYASARAELLVSAVEFASRSNEEKARYEMPSIDFAVGWSHGREQFRGRTDTCKGSYYANPVYDDPSNGDICMRENYPHIMTQNIWPMNQDSELANMEQEFKKIGQFINALGIDLAWHCDRYVERAIELTESESISFTKLHDSLAISRSQKGRLLHYFPNRNSQSEDDPFWCGFHNDHGTITGLVAGQFYDAETGKVLSTPPDMDAGLYVSPFASNRPIKVGIAANQLAFQIGETAQIMSGGILRAGPHAVRAPRCTEKISSCRSTLAVFLQPNPEVSLTLPAWDSDGKNALDTSPVVPPLSGRFADRDTFATFCAKTLQAYVVP